MKDLGQAELLEEAGHLFVLLTNLGKLGHDDLLQDVLQFVL